MAATRAKRDYRPIPERVLDGFDIRDDGCWEWKRARNDQGYGIVRSNTKILRAHRLMYEIVVGAIPDGLVIDHLCRNPWCVNPDHLDPVTQRVNVVTRGLLSVSSRNARKTACPRGHPYDGIWPHNGSRYCKTCHRAKIARQKTARCG